MTDVGVYLRFGPVAVLLLVLAAACGSESSTGIVAEQTPKPASTPTPFDLSRVALTPATGPFDAFTMEVPAGWDVQSTRIAGGFGQEYVLNDEHGTRVALLSVLCRVGVSVDSMMAEDQRVVQGVGGNYVRARATDLTFAGTTARQLDYGAALAGVPVNYRSIYLYREPCGWRLTLAVFGPGLFDQYVPLFLRVVSTFQPANFDVPFDDRDPYANEPEGNP